MKNIVTSDDAGASKPDPDILQAALKKLGVPSDAALMLGDTPYDVEAARRADIRCISVRCGGWTDRELQGSLAIYDNPSDFLAHYDDILRSTPKPYC